MALKEVQNNVKFLGEIAILGALFTLVIADSLAMLHVSTSILSLGALLFAFGLLVVKSIAGNAESNKDSIAKTLIETGILLLVVSLLANPFTIVLRWCGGVFLALAIVVSIVNRVKKR